MRVLVTGALGQLGQDVVVELQNRNHEVIGSDLKIDPDVEFQYTYLDITDQDSVYEGIDQLQPDAIIHCAAWTAVDDAELEENKRAVQLINATGTKYICNAAQKVNAKLLYLSTDYVFNGQGTEPWKPSDERHPLNFYGKTKFLGEDNIRCVMNRFFIVRISWVFGTHGKNFVKTMINAGKTHDSVRVVNDQIGSPTYTRDLSRLLVDMIESDKYGIYHVANEGGDISWYDFCCETYRQYGLDTKIIPVSTKEYGSSLAVRPHNSRLDKSKLIEMGFEPLPDWRDALSRYLKEANL